MFDISFRSGVDSERDQVLTVADLPTVPFQSEQILVGFDIEPNPIGDLDRVFGRFDPPLKVLFPDLLPHGGVKGLVEDGDVNSRSEGFVERAHAIRRDEQDPLIVLQRPEKDRDHTVALQVLPASSFQVDVGFIEQEDRTPLFRPGKELLELVFDRPGIDADVAGCDGHQRSASILRHTFYGFSR